MTVNIGPMLFDERVMGLKAKWGKRLQIDKDKSKWRLYGDSRNRPD